MLLLRKEGIECKSTPTYGPINLHMMRAFVLNSSSSQKLHQAEWNHLRFLLQQRRKVELEILRSMSAIESRSKKMIRDIVVILKAREEDLTSLNLKMNLSQA